MAATAAAERSPMARDPQFALLLGDDEPTDPRAGNPPLQASIAGDDAMPSGPFRVGMTHWWGGDGIAKQGRPYTVQCGDGRAVAGHVESLDCAEKIAEALNRVFPA